MCFEVKLLFFLKNKVKGKMQGRPQILNNIVLYRDEIASYILATIIFDEWKSLQHALHTGSLAAGSILQDPYRRTRNLVRPILLKLCVLRYMHALYSQQDLTLI